ncbi:MAG: hypothetical protein B6U76_04930 [Desulfurococcales archaeon ex4484_217_2]|nr:MAG: hypothetical protein B6U76_04930 [Desulfurococcales archaeon ex4484_217_2]
MYFAKPVIGIFIALLLLASAGIAYAMWSETLKINVTVNTGEVDVKWSNWYCNDTGSDPQAPGFNNSEGKDVAKCYVEPEKYDEEGDLIKLNVTIVNAYPGYRAVITGIVDNIGTIPVKLYNHTISSYDTDALDVTLGIPADTQIDAGDNATYTLTIDVLQNASENSTYSFEVTLVFAQWNEIP